MVEQCLLIPEQCFFNLKHVFSTMNMFFHRWTMFFILEQCFFLIIQCFELIIHCFFVFTSCLFLLYLDFSDYTMFLCCCTMFLADYMMLFPESTVHFLIVHLMTYQIVQIVLRKLNKNHLLNWWNSIATMTKLSWCKTMIKNIWKTIYVGIVDCYLSSEHCYL